MVDSNWSWTLTHYDESDSWSSTNITSSGFEIPRFTDASDKQINTAELILSADRGLHITTGDPIIASGDRIHLSINDGDGGVYGRWFEVTRRTPIKTKGQGTKLKLVMEGTERHLQKINYAKPHDFTTPKQAVIDIINHYNDNKGTLLPTVTIGTNELPDKGVFRFDFGLNEDTCWNRIYEVIESMGGAGTSGGVLDFFDARWVTTGVNSLTLNITSSGSTGSGVVVNADNVNTGESDGGLDEETASIVSAWGGTDDGSLPVEHSKFKSRQILMPTNQGADSQFPDWDAGQTPYPLGAIVRHNGLVYVSDINNNSSTPSTNWTQLTTETYYGGTVNANTGSSNIEYSPWTRNKAAHMKNSGADPPASFWSFSGTAQPSMWDINVIINDDTTFCVDADLSQTSSALTINSPEWLYDGTTPYDGLTVLVNGTGIGDFATHNNKIMEYNGASGEWRVKYEPRTDLMCSVYDEAKVYKYNGSSWVDITTSAGGNWCFHPYDSIGQAESVYRNPDTELEWVGNNDGSAVKIVYTWNPDDAWLQSVVSPILPNIVWANSPNYYKAGAWLNLRFPYPINTYNSVSDVGGVYGGSTSENLVTALDARNMHLTPDGKRGFNQGAASESYGQLSSLDFWIKMVFLDSLSNVITKGNFKMRCGLIDQSDHVVFQDFIVSHNNNWQSVKLPLSGFQIYRGRRPKFGSGFISDIFPPKGIPTDEQFEWRHIKGMVIQTQESYDDFGRYIGGNNDFGIGNVFGLTGALTLEMHVDALRFTKPLLVNSGSVADKPREVDFLQRQEIGNYEQLRFEVQSELEKQQFTPKLYDIQTTGRFDVSYGDTFTFEDDEIVDESDAGANTINLVAKYIEYSITKPEGGSGGFIRRIRGSRRFV